MIAATTIGTGQILLEILYFFLFVIEIWLMISIFIDIFRNHDMPGWKKALWVLFIIVLPLIGILVYLIVHGDTMRAHQVQEAQESEREYRRYLEGTGQSERSVIDELHRLADLRDRGAISAEEYQRLKDRVMSGDSDATTGPSGTDPAP